MITLSIDVTLLDKKRFKEVTRKNGAKAVFCDLVLFETQSEYGDYLVKQSTKKEEGRVEMPILGNAKKWNQRGGGTSAKHTNPNDDPNEVKTEAPEDDIPF
jgi:hypothetical protein